MSRNSHQRRKQKLRKRAQEPKRFDLYNSADRAIVMRDLKQLIANLTTPAALSDKVMEFSRRLSDQTPFFIDCEPEPWSRQSCCDRNVMEFAKIHGGEPVFGFRLWSNGDVYIEAERHAIWKNGDAIRDVSFVDTGETRILFLPDSESVTGGFGAASQKIRYAFTARDRQLLAVFKHMEAAVPHEQMTSDESWEVMPSYEEWQSGKRMPNIIPTVRTRVS
ncbi:hypothetical protein [Pseudoxanthomonas sp. UC19_8]|uniref:hypothetical protein n=1 Tax=Pseudoxanthomonas sp. UC19_8 TaxID=3350175 RepID=UPI0036D3C780